MSDSQIKRYDGITSCRVGKDEGRGVGTFCISNAVNPGKAVAGVMDVRVIG